MKSYDARPEEHLAEAYANSPGCPAPEVFLEASWNDLTDEERRRIEDHARRCPACASERELAREFDGSSEAEEVSSEDVDWVVSRLAAQERSTRRRLLPAWGLAAAAVVVLGIAVGLLAFRTPGPALPDPGSAPSVMRSSGIRAVQPKGDIPGLPERLSWEKVAGADHYRVRIAGVDDRILLEKTVRHPEVILSEEVRGALHRSVLYRWSVEAFDTEEALLARSGPVEFLVMIDGDAP